MAPPRLTTTINSSRVEIEKIRSKLLDLYKLDPKFQIYVAELFLLRLFAIYEAAVSEISYKLICGAEYSNGNVPNRLVAARSIKDARLHCLSFGRPRPITNLNWSKASDVTSSVGKCLDSADPFMLNIRSHGNILSEMRSVRNYVAHKNAKALKDFKNTVFSVYGSHAKISPGTFLVSTSRVSVRKIEEYSLSVQIIMFDCCKGY